jgi:hypothetical protein
MSSSPPGAEAGDERLTVMFQVVGWAAFGDAWASPQLRLRLDATLGGLPGPSDMTSVPRVHVFVPSLVVTMIMPAGELP